MGTIDCEEFKFAIRDIASHVHILECPFDRVRCTEWARKLINIPDDDLEMCKLKNEYAQYLRIQVRNCFLHAPFTEPPCEHGQLPPLSETLGKILSKNIPYLPASGQIQPVMQHKSPDGKAYISLKQVPGGGVLCYMAVTPDCFEK